MGEAAVAGMGFGATEERVESTSVDEGSQRIADAGSDEDQKIVKEIRKELKASDGSTMTVVNVETVTRATIQDAAKSFVAFAQKAWTAVVEPVRQGERERKANEAIYAFENKPTTERGVQLLQNARNAQQAIQDIYENAKGGPLTKEQSEAVAQHEETITIYYKEQFGVGDSQSVTTTPKPIEIIEVEKTQKSEAVSGSSKEEEREEKAQDVAMDKQERMDEHAMQKEMRMDAADLAIDMAHAITAATEQAVKSAGKKGDK